MSRRVSNYDARPFIANRREFHSHTQNFRGEEHTPGNYVFTGRLSGRFPTTDTVRYADYIVFSYSTPIAWHIPGEGWIVPPVSYSISTTRHQSIVEYVVSDYSPRNLAPEWLLGLTATGQSILRSIRYGNTVELKPRMRRSNFDDVVNTGEAAWNADGTAIVPVDNSNTLEARS